jgi:prevent-host-death family protein
MTTITLTEARRRLDRLVRAVQTSHVPVLLTGKAGNAVLVSDDDWRSIQETLYLLSSPGMRESVVEEMKTPTEEMSTELDW